MRKAIVFLFNFIAVFIPLIFYIGTSEVFEFNKTVAVYGVTVAIVTFWTIRMIIQKKIIFRRTMADIPLLIFLASQAASTLVSIDIKTSILGYYSRFNGGLASTIAYCLLYWAYVSNVSADETRKILRNFLLTAGLISIYGIFEHFGASISCLIITGQFNNNCWVQDVTTRVFATLGQPNWMAAYLVALVPLSFTLGFTNIKKFPKILYFSLGAIILMAILFTKSRSGLVGLAVSYFLFTCVSLFAFKKELFKSKYLFKQKHFLKIVKHAVVVILLTATVIGVFGTPWTKSVGEILTSKNETTAQKPDSLEGGTESGDIRKIVWNGAINIWRAYPIFGTGPETFAFSYYRFRPKEHNLVSEWDFLYNKAHNEYLNLAANTGAVGLISYLILVSFLSFEMLSFVFSKDRDVEDRLIGISCFSGFVSVLATNFFGFSVVVTQLLLFLFPAMVISLLGKRHEDEKSKILPLQKWSIFGVSVIGLCLTYFVLSYWLADTLYARAKAEIEVGNASAAVSNLTHAISKTPWEGLYHDKLAQVYSAVAVADSQTEQKDSELEKKLILLATYEIENAAELSPQNFVILQDRVNVYSDLAKIDKNYHTKTVTLLTSLTTYAPTYAKTYYKLAIVHQNLGQKEKAVEYLKKAIELKSNYLEAKDLLAKLTNQKPQ